MTTLVAAALAPTPRAARVGVGVAATAWLVLAATGALCLALRMPVATTVLGLAAFGVLHNVLELRYVAGRYDSVLSGGFLVLLIGLVTAVAVCRLVPLGGYNRIAEIVLCYGVLAAACVRVSRGRVLRGRGWALAVIGVAAATSLSFPVYHFVVLAHLHNVVPLFFLWEWSRVMPSRTRWAFRAANVTWVLVIPALLLAGVFDGLLHGSAAALGGFGGVAAFDPGQLAPTYTPPALSGAGLRFLTVFAFMQTMHYVVWVAILPRYAPEAAARFDARVPILRRGRAWLLGGGLAVALGIVFALDYASGRTLYFSAASYHAYLEFPVLLAMILGSRRLQGAPAIQIPAAGCPSKQSGQVNREERA